MFGNSFKYWWLTRKKHRVSEVEWRLLTADVDYLFGESEALFEELSELYALVEFWSTLVEVLLENQEKAQKHAKAVKKATPIRTTKKA